MTTSAAPANDRRRAAGWYDDDADASSLRYWDGRGWTPHTAPKSHDPGVAAGPDVSDPMLAALAAPAAALAALAAPAEPDPAITHTVRLAPEHTTVPTPLAGPVASVSVYGVPPTRPDSGLSGGQVALLVLASLAAGALTIAAVSAIAMMLFG